MLTLGCVLFCVALHAQWTIGPKISYGMITQKAAEIPVMPQSDFIVYDLEYLGSSAVTSVGFMAENDLGPVFLQTEVLATTYGMDFYLSGYKSQGDNSRIYRENYYFVEIPFAAGIKKKNFKIGVGPVIDIKVDEDSELKSVDGYRDTSKSMDFGFQGLIGYNLGVFHFDAKYVNKFSSIADGFAFGYDRLQYKKSANRLTLSVGVAF